MKSAVSTLYTYAGSLLLPALASVLYNAETKVTGWNPSGKTGLIICGVCAVLAAVFASVLSKGRKWALWAGLALAFLLLCTAGSNVFKIMRGVSAGTLPDWHYYKAAVFGVLGLFSFGAFMRLFLASRTSE